LWLVEQAGDYATSRFHHSRDGTRKQKGTVVNNIIHIVGLIVVVLAVLAFFGLR